ncbi:peptidase S8/S53 domain-containing protein [Podospora australis]|uniref:Peptidase S8/S53 domain-containing protein n=1 Tax=Podospora australis TaxID=1536484 RepID=A0AAN6WNS2_9PEZI|nr:peptidase S8/S53 domain-containing protein [Podospora australis]
MLFSAAALFSLLPLVLGAPSSEPLDKRAPLLQARGGKVIPGQYIVKFKDGAAAADTTILTAAAAAVGKFQFNATHIYKGAFKGFSASLTSQDLERVRNLPEVEYIEEDALVSIAGGDVDHVPVSTKTGTAPRAIVSQINAPWNLARLSSHTPGSTTYKYDSTAGAGTCVYVLGTGIYTAHAQFAGGAVWGTNVVDTTNTDGNGHGTAIAGIIRSTIYGVAKQTKVIAVKVLGSSGSGTTSGIIAGMNWVISDYPTRGCPNGVVAALTFGGSFSTAVNTAARNLVNAGIFTTAGVGSSNTNVANSSPASEPLVCAVGATSSNDVVGSFNDYGPLLDIYAPGTLITTTWNTGTTATNTLTGTTLAMAHIAGLGAYLLGLPSALTGSGLCAYMRSIATSGVLTNVPPNTSNLLAYNGWDL